MNKEDYVSLEVAKLLKEKGFDRDTMCCYLSDGTFWDMENVPFNYNKCFRADLCPHNEDEDMDCYHCSKNCKYWGISTTSAPSLYEAQKWLRQYHRIHLHVLCTAYCKPLNRCDYRCEIFYFTNNQFTDTPITHNYEEALNAGILEALRLI